MKSWFKTQSNQILNLNDCEYFWIEDLPYERPMKFIVFCKTKDTIEWRIAIFQDQELAESYIDEIYLLLERNNES